ncbi:MAG TPA: trigger factor [Dehalococcoidia bacterium]|nr:trigger factor [Dehalococcoidia bacterium]
MKVTREKIENSQAFLTIEMEPAEVEKSLAEAYRRLVKKTNIPGFRKGKAPREVLERYLGKESFMEDALSHLVPQAYEQALKEQQIEAIAQPHIELIQTDPVIFKATVPLMPVVKLGDYHHIQVAPEPVEVTDDRVDAVIERLRHQNATWEPVDRAADFGDLVVLDIESHVGGEPFINQKGAQYQLVRDSTYPVPGFSHQLAGMKKGEEKEFKLQLPADFPEKLREKEASFKVRVAEIKEEILPELNDEFARQLGPELKTVAALKEEVATNLKLRAEEKARMDFEEKVIDAVVDQAQVEFPPILVEAEIHRLIDEQSRRFQIQGGSLEEYLESTNKTEEQLHEELYPIAVRRVTRSLVLGKVAEEEKIEVEESEIDAEIENMVSNAGENKEALWRALGSPRSRESIRQILLTRKTINRLVEIAKDANMHAGARKEEEK